MLGALLHVEALDELRAEAAEKDPRDEALAQLALRDEGVLVPGQDREQYRAVEIAGVVRRHHIRSIARQVLQPAHREGDRTHPQEQPRAALAEPPGRSTR